MYIAGSRDYQAILKLLDLILTAVKEEIDDIQQVLDPFACPEALLPLLASYVGYMYDNHETVQANRVIIANYQNIIHNRGSETGIKTACALSFNAKDKDEEVEPSGLFTIEYKRSEGKIMIYIYYPEYLDKIRDLIERARPAGVPLEVIPAFELQTVDKIEIHDYINPERKPYDKTRYNVGDSSVGFSEVTKKREKKWEDENEPDYIHYDKDTDTE